MFIPNGYMTLVDAVAAIDELFIQFDPLYDGLDDCVERVGVRLSSGELATRGIDVQNGLDFPIPAQVWRQSYSAIFLKLRFPQNIKYEPNRPVALMVPIVKKTDVLELFDVNNELEGYFKPFKKAEWTLDVAVRDHWTDGGAYFERNKAVKVQTTVTTTTKNILKVVGKPALRAWLRDIYIPFGNNSVPTPNEQMAWKAAIAAFPQNKVPRQRYREIHRELAPPEWKSGKKVKRSKVNTEQ
jgi:hypothetical protein